MELKYRVRPETIHRRGSFNRTAYGIEIAQANKLGMTIFAFNRTAYGIEISNQNCGELSKTALLIAPLMELKLNKWRLREQAGITFNRTAYGIEIQSDRPTMTDSYSFNRTAYGIEMIVREF